MFSLSALSLNVIPVDLESRTSLPASPHTTQQPICQSHKFGAHTILPFPMALHMLDGMAQHPSFAIKLKNKQPRESGLARALLADLEELAERQPPTYARAARGPPAHNQLLGARTGPFTLVFDHTLRQDLELHVANDG